MWKEITRLLLASSDDDDGAWDERLQRSSQHTSKRVVISLKWHFELIVKTAKKYNNFILWLHDSMSSYFTRRARVGADVFN